MLTHLACLTLSADWSLCKKYRLLKSNLLCKRLLIVVEVSEVANGLRVIVQEIKMFMLPCSCEFPL